MALKIKAKPTVITKRVVTMDEYLKIQIRKLPEKSDDVYALKFLLVPEETAKSAWNKSLPVPLVEGEKVLVLRNGTEKGYVRVFHGQEEKVKGVFAISHFRKMDGTEVFWQPRSYYLNRLLLTSGKKQPEWMNAKGADERFTQKLIIPRIMVKR